MEHKLLLLNNFKELLILLNDSGDNNVGIAAAIDFLGIDPEDFLQALPKKSVINSVRSTEKVSKLSKFF